jgi:release factor glutamine methyltransferase
MTIKEAFNRFSRHLAPVYEAREASFVADMVLEKVTGMTRLDRITRPETPLSAEQQAALQDLAELLRTEVPVQYALGEAWFYGMPLYVNADVLIPRPETEELVSWILEEEKGMDRQRPPDILDIGTGSGCIAIALKKKLPLSRLFAIDKSTKALSVAMKNAAAHHTQIRFLEADILEKDSLRPLPEMNIIVSNPPYIPFSERAHLQARVADHEPPEALFVQDDDPLLFYRAILEAALSRLTPGGKVYAEIHEDAGADITCLFAAYGFREVVLRKDMSGRDRMVRAVR